MKNNNGFTLIEIMVAMAISLIALLAVSELYVNSKKTSNLQSIQNRVSEDGRYSIFMLQKIISQAGFRPNPNVAMPTDRITVTSNESVSVKFNTDGANQMACDGSVATADPTTLVISKSANKLQCGTVDWIAPSASGIGYGTELIDFKIKYGIDTGPANTEGTYGCGTEAPDTTKPRDCVTDSYVSSLSGGVTADQVTSVKICLVLRSEKTDSSIVKSAVVKDCNNNDIASSQEDKKLYRTFRSTILLKNS
nr:prepilin-type N-terminal cleavage/methylation domain-containing protein [uncultured Deefgea sp.]